MIRIDHRYTKHVAKTVAENVFAHLQVYKLDPADKAIQACLFCKRNRRTTVMVVFADVGGHGNVVDDGGTGRGDGSHEDNGACHYHFEVYFNHYHHYREESTIIALLMF